MSGEHVMAWYEYLIVIVFVIPVAILKPLMGNGDFMYLEYDDWHIVRHIQIEWWFDNCDGATPEQKTWFIAEYQQRYEQVSEQSTGRYPAMRQMIEEWNARNGNCQRRAPVINVAKEILMCFDGTRYWKPRQYPGTAHVCFAEDQEVIP